MGHAGLVCSSTGARKEPAIDRTTDLSNAETGTSLAVL
jgi:hypothetical protein